MERFDTVVVGSGPNGLAAAITFAEAGRSVVLLEANDTVGGAARTAELTRPGFHHDLASAIHPMGRASPFFRSQPLEDHGLRWIDPPAGAAHPLDDQPAGVAWNDLDAAADRLGADAAAYRRYYSRWVERFDAVTDLALNPLLRVPPNPLLAARFGAMSALPAATTARRVFDTTAGQALFAGHAAHAILPLTNPFTSSFGLLLGASVHAVGWPFPEGGAQAISDALASRLRDLGGEIRTSSPVRSMADVPPSDAVVFALTPRQVVDIAGDELPDRYRSSLRRFTYGAAAWKVDWALSEPIPWSDPDVASAATVHLGGTLDEIVAAEAEVAAGRNPDRPFVLLAQQSLFDPTRAPDGRHTAWAYCHVPNGSTVDRTEAIEAQIERFAPGFRDVVLGRSVTSPAGLEAQNMNLVGGDVGGGSFAGTQLFFRPRVQANPWTTPNPRLFIGSASTAPGSAVHGMAGHGAARRALATTLK
jgi:phytoene dehydrogenase-like protein